MRSKHFVRAALAVLLLSQVPMSPSRASGSESGGGSTAADEKQDDNRTEKREEMRRKMREKKNKQCGETCPTETNCCTSNQAPETDSNK